MNYKQKKIYLPISTPYWWRAYVNAVMNLRVPENAGKFSSSCTIGSFSRTAQLHE
jgi:hypothetical protein